MISLIACSPVVMTLTGMRMAGFCSGRVTTFATLEGGSEGFAERWLGRWKQCLGLPGQRCWFVTLTRRYPASSVLFPRHGAQPLWQQCSNGQSTPARKVKVTRCSRWWRAAALVCQALEGHIVSPGYNICAASFGQNEQTKEHEQTFPDISLHRKLYDSS